MLNFSTGKSLNRGKLLGISGVERVAVWKKLGCFLTESLGGWFRFYWWAWCVLFLQVPPVGFTLVYFCIHGEGLNHTISLYIMEIAFGAMSLDLAGGDMILKLNRSWAYVLFSLKFTFSCIMDKALRSTTLKRGSRLNEPRCRYYNLISLKPLFGSPLATFRYIKLVIKVWDSHRSSVYDTITHGPHARQENLAQRFVPWTEVEPERKSYLP